ncbi:GGDEF domain-containing protein [Marinomonas transparens]|uniref:diguanylate cyclase n=1 Tax=Marinomonas transparens TaxID=2795388 RepID=A0A934JKK2_9GAMM|nr:GGDEF domain-containing protein [Marinomonas transparens]MBJ7536068.1 GGDEF domain-containing protein [Marinomonas transparens]
MIIPSYSANHLPTKVLRGLCLVLSILAIIFAAFNTFVNHIYLLAIIELFFAASSFFLYRYTGKHPFQGWHKRGYIGLIFFSIMYATLTMPLNYGVFFWAFCLPTIYYLILGLRYGIILTCFSLFTIIAAFYINASGADIDLYNKIYLNQLLNFVCGYITLSVISHAYESNKQSNENALYKLAHIDNLTGALNRRAFNNTIESLAEKKLTAFFMLLDVDHFKKVNDQYDHEMGDYVLKQIVTIMSDIAGSDNVFRYGGEEFCILLTDDKFDKPSVLEKAEAIRSTIESTSMISLDPERKVTISIGISRVHPLMDVQHDISLADANLYKAKDQGRNQVVFD